MLKQSVATINIYKATDPSTMKSASFGLEIIKWLVSVENEIVLAC